MSVTNDYSLDREQLAWQGLDLTEGLADGDGVIADSQDGDQGWTQKPRGTGGTVQMYNSQSHGTLTLQIDMEHPLHLSLKSLHNQDRVLRNVVGPITRKRNSGEVITYENARIQRAPDESTGVTSGTAEWQWIYSERRSALPDTIANVVVPRSA